MSVGCSLNDRNNNPVNFFPPILRDAVEEIERELQAPVELIETVVLAAVSLACQGVIKIQHPDGRVSPCPMYYTVIADSGERKSAVFKLVTQPFFDFEKESRQKYTLLMLDYNAELQSWKSQEKALLKVISKKTEKGIDVEYDTQSMKELYRKKPQPPALHKLIYSDTTPEALQQGLCSHVPSSSLMSDEAGIFFKGRAKNNLGFLNLLWDGAPFDIERKSGRCSMDECMFTMLLMIQSSEFKKYIKLQGDYAVGSGFLSRFMITGVTSKRGHRSSVKNNSKSNTIRFHDRIKELLLLSEERYKNNEKHKYLYLSEEAQSALGLVYKHIESRILKDNEMHPVVEGMLSKMPENIVRLAGVFHLFSDEHGTEISERNIKAGAETAYFYYQQALDAISSCSDSIEHNADILYKWLLKYKDPDVNYPQILNTPTILNKMIVRRKGPYALRNSRKLNDALSYLEEDEKIRIEKIKNSNGSTSEIIHIHRH
ncbi:YfjI family protein [Klebsiella huaxiensis]|uniref:YfjI family protein n=7 Tax=Klebsiella/Raoultella group TaxID=2890311 RepID=A0ABT6E6S2_9ENTR|nr:YfjI family protein [Klebsiella huaxiensis]MDG1641099.1 YfjI family protein [Klebsiella huaxiensis]